MALTPFQTTTDPFWNMGMDVPGMDMFPGQMGSQLGFPNVFGNQVGFPSRIGSQLGFPNLPTPQVGIDLTEEPDKWVVHADLPGYKDEDVNLTIENGMLGIHGTRDKTVESDTGISHRVEVYLQHTHKHNSVSCAPPLCISVYPPIFTYLKIKELLH